MYVLLLCSWNVLESFFGDDEMNNVKWGESMSVILMRGRKGIYDTEQLNMHPRPKYSIGINVVLLEMNLNLQIFG
jgi:hypothetical protein